MACSANRKAVGRVEWVRGWWKEVSRRCSPGLKVQVLVGNRDEFKLCSR